MLMTKITTAKTQDIGLYAHRSQNASGESDSVTGVDIFNCKYVLKFCLKTWTRTYRPLDPVTYPRKYGTGVSDHDFYDQYYSAVHCTEHSLLTNAKPIGKWRPLSNTDTSTKPIPEFVNVG